MKNLSGWKLWVLIGLSAVVVGAVFLLQPGPEPEQEPVAVGGEGVPTDEFTRQFMETAEPEVEGAGDALAPGSEGGDGLVDGAKGLPESGAAAGDLGLDGPVEAAGGVDDDMASEAGGEGGESGGEAPAEMEPESDEGALLERVGEPERAVEVSGVGMGEVVGDRVAGVEDPFLDEVTERSPVEVKEAMPEPGREVVGPVAEAAAVVSPVAAVSPVAVGEMAEGMVTEREEVPGPGGDGRSGSGRRIEFEGAWISDLEAALDAELEAARLEETAGAEVEGVDVAVEGKDVAVVVAPGSAEDLGGNLPLRLWVPQARGGVRVLRDTLGYRVPMVVRHVVPDEIKGGVYVPAHETYVIARVGHWEVEGEAVPEAVASDEDDAVVVEEEPRYLLPWLWKKLRRPRGDGGTQ